MGLELKDHVSQSSVQKPTWVLEGVPGCPQLNGVSFIYTIIILK